MYVSLSPDELEGVYQLIISPNGRPESMKTLNYPLFKMIEYCVLNEKPLYVTFQDIMDLQLFSDTEYFIKE